MGDLTIDTHSMNAPPKIYDTRTYTPNNER